MTAFPFPVSVVAVVACPLVGTVVSPVTVRGKVAVVATLATLLSSLGAAILVNHVEVWGYWGNVESK